MANKIAIILIVEDIDNFFEKRKYTVISSQYFDIKEIPHLVKSKPIPGIGLYRKKLESNKFSYLSIENLEIRNSKEIRNSLYVYFKKIGSGEITSKKLEEKLSKFYNDPFVFFKLEIKKLTNVLDEVDETPPQEWLKMIDFSYVSTKESGPNITETMELPQSFRARPRFLNYDALFFDSIALPQNFLFYLRASENLTFSNFLPCAFRIDFPSSDIHTDFSSDEKIVFSVVEKILTRGRFTMISPKIENAIKEKLDLDFNEEFEQKFNRNELNPEILLLTHNQVFEKFDSNEENIFYEWFTKNYSGTIIPQVYSESLTPKLNYNRIDFFVFFHPQLPLAEIKGFVIEIDGKQHQNQKDSDKLRDLYLSNAKYNVIRIPAELISNNDFETIENKYLYELKDFKKKDNVDISSETTYSFSSQFIKFFYSYKIAYQIQISLLVALRYFLIDIKSSNQLEIITDINKIGLFKDDEANIIFTQAVNDFFELLQNVSKVYNNSILNTKPVLKLYSEAETNQHALFINFTTPQSPYRNTLYVQNIYLPYKLCFNSLFQFREENWNRGKINPTKENLNYFLKYIFRFDSFREGQDKAIIRLLQGKDTIVLLPTGAGKSLIYQLSSMLLPGLTIIIDPIISLMEDQIYNLSLNGIDRCVPIYSTKEKSKIRGNYQELFSSGEFLFIFVAPERFQIKEFRSYLRSAVVHKPFSLITIDEVHCVSEWGHDFRTSYLRIGKVTREYCKNPNATTPPPLVGLTGTASAAVLSDIKRILEIPENDIDAIVSPTSFNRPNLKFMVEKCEKEPKFIILERILTNVLPNDFHQTFSTFYETKGSKTNSGLIFCPHVDGDTGVFTLSRKISEEIKITCKYYSGNPPKEKKDDFDFSKYKKYVTREFKLNKLPLLVCTKAFGMGIDKPNIRFTIHYGIPQSIESFYQEAGRAGRDNKTSYCYVIPKCDSPDRKELFDPTKPFENFKKHAKESYRDDIDTLRYFHNEAFKGEEEELNDLETVLKEITKKTLIGKKRILLLTGTKHSNMIILVQIKMRSKKD